jgi:hypothetical protein
MPLSSINIYTLKQIRTKRHRYDLDDYPITSPLTCYKVLQFLIDLKSEPVEKFELRRLKLENKTRKNFRLPNSVKPDFRALNFYFENFELYSSHFYSCCFRDCNRRKSIRINE